MTTRRRIRPAPHGGDDPDPIHPAPQAPPRGDAETPASRLGSSKQGPDAGSAEHTRILLSQTPYFQGLPAQTLDLIASATRQVPAQRNEIIVHRGDPCTSLHLVVRGQVKLSQAAASGLERIMRIVSAGDSFGEALMFLGRDYLFTAEALCDTLLLAIRRDVLLEQLERNPPLARQFMASLSHHLYMMMGDMSAYTVRSGHQRLIGYLLRESRGLEGVPFRLAVNKGTIAARLNLTPQHFSRILHDLSARQLIQVRGREFTILDATALRTCQNE